MTNEIGRNNRSTVFMNNFVENASIVFNESENTKTVERENFKIEFSRVFVQEYTRT